MSAIQLAFLADRKVIIGLHVTLASLLRRLPASTSTTAHVLCDKWTDDDRNALRATAAKTHQLCSLHFHDMKWPQLRQFRAALGTHINYALFLFPAELSGRVLFLDSDLLVRTNVEPLFGIDLAGNVAAAVSWEPLAMSCDKDLFREMHIPLDHPHYNSGVLLVDCDAWRQAAVASEALALRAKYDRRLIGADQPILNAILHGRIHPMERRYNTLVSPHRILAKARLHERRVWHLVGRPKPWDFLGEYLHCLGMLFRAELRGTAMESYRSLRHPIRGLRTMVRYYPKYLLCVAACFRRLLCGADSPQLRE